VKLQIGEMDTARGMTVCDSTTGFVMTVLSLSLVPEFAMLFQCAVDKEMNDFLLFLHFYLSLHVFDGKN